MTHFQISIVNPGDECLILDSSVGLSVGIQSAGDSVPETLRVRILYSAEETTCLLLIPKSLAYARASKLTTTNMHSSVWSEFLSFKLPSKPYEPSFHLTMSSMDPLYWPLPDWVQFHSQAYWTMPSHWRLKQVSCAGFRTNSANQATFKVNANNFIKYKNFSLIVNRLRHVNVWLLHYFTLWHTIISCTMALSWQVWHPSSLIRCSMMDWWTG